ncbi:acetylornithine aminotransferase [Nonlabens sp. Hel1_33_55]|uniref:aspartate aminotransferase family protein n=1 Tax=Nonlabens sp. Hel1_33_55 TaxID=1336802 RepID=UPI000875CCB3|nr:aspartate aminotransferase family protein [Nonlabens sp. Hel1_33_55]SCX94920.1 acetylornithine aminotransferase [Nonlabens sp. Hel1_33_55]
MKEDFFKYQAPTTPFAPGLEIDSASGNYITDIAGKKYLDMVAGVSALPLGHCHPKIIAAVKTQLDRYMHVMVYGEYSQQPAVELCKLLASTMPAPLEMTYLVNSGTEAIEASIKLARTVTQRSEIIAMKNCYHGNTLGSLSLMDYEERKAPFRPLLPDVNHIQFNCLPDLNKITERTAAVIMETIQGGAGFIMPDERWFNALREKCTATGSLLILDEIQPGVGRTGTMWHFQQYGIVPDVVVSGKGLAGGLPIGSLTASAAHLNHFKTSPMLGHITTFGGNPVIASAALATLKAVVEDGYMERMKMMELRFRESLLSKNIVQVRGTGLMLAAILPDAKYTAAIVDRCREKGVIFFLLLFEKRAIRITPPYTVTMDEIDHACNILKETIAEFYN